MQHLMKSPRMVICLPSTNAFVFIKLFALFNKLTFVWLHLIIDILFTRPRNILYPIYSVPQWNMFCRKRM